VCCRYTGYLAWLASPEGAASGAVPTNAAEFYARLQMFVASPTGLQYEKDVVWRDPADVTQGIFASRVTLLLSAPPNDPETEIRTMRDSRRCVAGAPQLSPRVYTFLFLYTEGSVVIEKELYTNVIASTLLVGT
jgi:hypothetical protein